MALSTSGAPDVTSTDCSTTLGCSTTGNLTVWSTASVIPVKLCPLKPGIVTVIEYSPRRK